MYNVILIIILNSPLHFNINNVKIKKKKAHSLTLNYNIQIFIQIPTNTYPKSAIPTTPHQLIPDYISIKC